MDKLLISTFGYFICIYVPASNNIHDIFILNFIHNNMLFAKKKRLNK